MQNQQHKLQIIHKWLQMNLSSWSALKHVLQMKCMSHITRKHKRGNKWMQSSERHLEIWISIWLDAHNSPSSLREGGDILFMLSGSFLSLSLCPAFGFSNGWTRWGFEKKHSNSNILIWLFEVVYTSSTTVYAWGSEASVLLFSKKSPWYSSPFLSLSSQLSFSFSISFSLSFLLHVAAWVLE